MPSKHHYALILAGGRGTRFWPRSRTRNPKQLLGLTGGQSLLQATVERLRPLIPGERIWVLTSEDLRAAVRKQLPGIPASQVLAEPAMRNTAPSLGLASQMLLQLDPDATLGVFPADHHIDKPARFRTFLKPAYAAAEKGRIVTLGIRPRWAETGYGYLEFPASGPAGDGQPVRIVSFREKPDAATAESFLAAGRFLWNAGIFFWRASVFAAALRQYLPKTAALLASLPPAGDRGFRRALGQVYPLCDSISVDYAVMEQAARAGKVDGIAVSDIGWNDLGSWNALWELLARDQASNVARTEAVSEASSGCLVEAPGKLVALVGVRDLIVVDTPDALLVAHRTHAQDVGKIVRQLEKQGRKELL